MIAVMQNAKCKMQILKPSRTLVTARLFSLVELLASV